MVEWLLTGTLNNKDIKLGDCEHWARHAQLVELQPVNLEVVGPSPTLVHLSLFHPKSGLKEDGYRVHHQP